MNAQEFLESLAGRVSANASVRHVYGDPVSVGDCTVIPAARVRYAFGGGTGIKGGGGGGRVSAEPLGAIEIRPGGARFVGPDRRGRLIALAVGFALGAALMALSAKKRIEIIKRSA